MDYASTIYLGKSMVQSINTIILKMSFKPSESIVPTTVFIGCGVDF